MRKQILTLFLSLLVYYSFSQEKIITGKVGDKDGNPLPNVSVTIKGTSNGTKTTEDGKFSLSVRTTDKTLVFSYVGLETKELAIGNQNQFTVSLLPANNDLNEVVVVAYGAMTKKKTTGSTVKVNGSEFKSVPQPSVDMMLQGKASGLQSVATSGQAGALSQIRIRGIGSITASSEPLWVIDGVPVVSGDPTAFQQSSNLLAGLNPDDIEDLTILKDAAASAIYGSRASNGVVLVTTKKGKVGKAKFNISTEVGNNDIAYFPDIARPLNKDQYRDITVAGLNNVGATTAQINGILDQLGYNLNANTDWLSAVRRRGVQQQVNVSVSGASSNASYYLSGGYFRQESPVIGSDFKRYSATFNGSLKATDKLSFTSSVSFTTVDQRGELEGSNFRNPVFLGLANRPSQPIYSADGSFEVSRTIFEQLFNPLAIIEFDRVLNTTNKLLANVGMEYKILPKLIFKSKIGNDLSFIDELRYWNPFFGDARPPVNGRLNTSFEKINNLLFSNTLEYSSKFLSNKLDLNALIGSESQKVTDKTNSAGGTGLPLTTSIRFPSVATPVVTNLVDQSDNSLESYFGRVLLSYNNKYNLSASIRRDGSSRFAPDSRWGTFWSVGGSWNISDEDFFKKVKFISSLKLRASYGLTGNNSVGNYLWRATYAFGGNYSGEPASTPGNVGNPSLTWEKNKTLDIGIDLGLLDNRITIDAGYYNRITTDLLLNEPISSTTGFTAFSNNIGSMRNRGLELTMNFIPIKSKDLQWSLGFNIAFNKNRVLSLSSSGADIVQLPYIRRIGEDFQSIYTRLFAGADPATGNPLWYTNASRTATTSNFALAERSIIGSASPKGFGGLNTSIRYKNFSLSSQFNFQYGNLLNDQWGFLYDSDGAFPNLNKNQKQLKRWQKPGDVTMIPRYDYNNATNSNAGSTRYFYKGDFIRLRNLMVSYDLPSVLVKKWGLAGLNFYVRGTNLFTKTFDPALSIEPEQPINGTGNNQYFIPKSYTVGINLSF